MSIDTTISELLASVALLTAATEKNTSILERVLAGQENALAKVEAAAGATGTTTRRRSSAAATTTAPETTAAAATPETKAEPAPVHVLLAAPNGETVKNAKDEAEPTANYRAGSFDRQDVKNEFIGWLGSTTDPEARKERIAFVGAIGAHFGVKLPFDPANGIKDPDHFKQTLFFLRRKREGLKVDFNADYDFDGDPLADQTVDVAEDDGIGALG